MKQLRRNAFWRAIGASPANADTGDMQAHRDRLFPVARGADAVLPRDRAG
jgi:hypothetical protein